MQRQGMCNLCGQCCGTEGPYQRSPWPTPWYPLSTEPCWRHWQVDDLIEISPILSIFGMTGVGEDTIGIPEPVGSYRVKGKLYYYVWVPGHSVCKDTSAAHDGNSWSFECPFLMPDPGDGTRPCALIGSQDDGTWKKECEPYPPEVSSAERVAEWQMRHPDCSYTWIE